MVDLDLGSGVADNSFLDLGHKHHKSHKKAHHKKHEKKPEQPQAHAQQTPATNATAPAQSSLLNTKAVGQDAMDAHGFSVDVPIDEVRAITLKVVPTYERDHINSITLKSFRKVVGYDTFNSIRKGDRDEKKDPADYYNITVSMMVKRTPENTKFAPLRDPYDGSKSLT